VGKLRGFYLWLFALNSRLYSY